MKWRVKYSVPLMNSLISGPEISGEAQKHPYWTHVTRVCKSQCFHSSHRTREFLIYVADCALRDAREEATEQHIGIHVFGRLPGYNSSEDSIVRTHARLLRQKLAEYYSQEGEGDDVIIEIPKGHYLPAFRLRQPSESMPAPTVPVELHGPPAPVLPMPVSAPQQRHARWWRTAFLCGFLCALTGLGAWIQTGRHDAVDRLWAPFLADNGALVIYSNAIFIGDSKSGLKYAAPQDVAENSVSDRLVQTYTGIGELASVYDLTQLFDHHRAHFLLKRSMLVTWDEARGNNLIFIGSTAENASLRVLPSTREFTMVTGDGYAGFVNHSPRAGELGTYIRPEHPLNKDYALIALLPGLQPGKSLLIFSGLTTFGTEAAVEFACHRDTAEQLVNAAKGPKGEIRPFEALLETSIGGGVPLETRLVALHLR